MFRLASLASKRIGNRRTAAALTVGVGAGATTLLWRAQSTSADAGSGILKLYQYEVCPFCNKVRAYLDYHHVPYQVVEVNPMTKEELPTKDYKKVPVVVTADGQTLVDSGKIIEKLNAASVERGEPGYSPLSDGEQQWLKWIDTRLVKLLAPNIYRNFSESLEAFDYISTYGTFALYQRQLIKYTGATVMYFVARNKKKEYGIGDERAELMKALEEWVGSLEGRPFHGGSSPSTADLAVFGVLRAIRPLRVWKDVQERVPLVDEWFARTEVAVGPSARR